MKDSGVQWIGQVPEHWKVCKIKQVCRIFGRIGFRGYTQDDLVDAGEGAITLSPSNMQNGKMNFNKCNYLTWKKYYESPEIMINDGDILFVKTGSTYGKTSIVENLPMEATINPQIVVLKEIKMNNYFLYYLLLTEIVQGQVSCSVGGSTIPTLSQESISNYVIPLPPLSEQRAIADWLDAKCADIDAAIELQQRMIDKLKAYKTAVIHQAVTKGLDKNANLKDSGVQWIGEVPEHWEVCKIKNIGLFYSGLVNKRGDDFNVEETDKFAYYIPFTNIFNNVEIDVTQLRKVKVNPVEAQNEAKENDIFFLMSSEDTEGIGKTAVLRELIAEYKPLYLNSFCKGLRITSNEVDAIFLNYFMSSDAGNTYCRLQANGFIRINLRLTKLVDCPVLLPPLAEQRAIADWLDAKCADIDATIALKEQKQEKLKAYKKTIIFEYVTGKKQVANINKQL
jgi:type I restriction-modification system specificity subunit, putative